MNPFQFKCRAVDIEQESSDCPSELQEYIANIIKQTQGMQFIGKINSSKNSYQITSNFDQVWIKALNENGWEHPPINPKNIGEIPDIKPDAILSKNSVIIIVEIEKTNKKTIWFDLIKMMMHIGGDIVNFGILVVPRNYAHKYDPPWDLFIEAVNYKSYLLKYAKVENNLLSKISIIGYTQESYIDGVWKQHDSSVVKSVKEQAHAHFENSGD